MTSKEPGTGGTGTPSLPGGRYDVTAKIGEGGMATVYRAYDRRAGEWVAVKVLLPSYGERPNVRARFHAEARAMSGLHHRNVIAVTDVSTDVELPYFVMELAEGGCLIDWLEAHGPMPPRMATDVIIQICKGLGAAHRAGVVHRDIKPHNILVNRRGVCKITDFGIAQFAADSANLTRTGSVMGTLGFIAPEQRSNAKTVDERSDLYSVGATLYTLLTARTTMDLFFADQEPELLEGVPPQLVPVITKATRYRREDRYPSVRALAKALHVAKSTLPDDPPDTPSLVMHTSSYERDDDHSDDLSGTAVADSVPPTPSFPRPLDRPPEIPPDLASVSLDLAAPTMLTPTSPITAGPTHRATARSAPDPGERAGRMASRAALAAVPFLLVAMTGATALGVGSRAVGLQERATLVAADAWFGAVEAERSLIPELAQLGADVSDISGRYAELGRISDPYSRATATDEFEHLARQVVAQHASAHAGSDRIALANRARQRLARIEQQHLAYSRALAGWRDVAERGSGRLAVRLGLADGPPAVSGP